MVTKVISVAVTIVTITSGSQSYYYCHDFHG